MRLRTLKDATFGVLLAGSALCLGAAAGVLGQPLSSAEVAAGRPFRVAADHDGQGTSEYRLYVAQVRQGGTPLHVGTYVAPVAALRDGTIAIDVPGLAAGQYVLQATAYNVAGESVADQPLYLTVVAPPVTGAPLPPGKVRVGGGR